MSERKMRLRARTIANEISREINITGLGLCQTIRWLIAAGDTGITALQMPSKAFRLGHYVFVLRKQHGLPISTEHEEHPGGFHNRYRLLCEVEILDGNDIWITA